MKVRFKLLFSLSLVLISIGLVSVLLKSSITRDTRLLLHDKLTECREKDVPNILQLNAAVIKGYAYDYGVWDQMVNFVAVKKDSGWAHDELDEALANYKVDYVWVLDSLANGYYYSSINKTRPVKPLDIPASRLKQLFTEKPFLSFFIHHNGDVVEVFTSPIQPTADRTRTSSPKGFLLLGRTIDSVYMASLQGISRETHISFVAAADALPEKISAGTGLLQYNMPLKDVNGATLAAFNIQQSFPVLSSYQRYLNIYLLLFLGLIAVVIIIFFWRAKKLLLQPLSLFSNALRTHDASRLNPYIKKPDELGDLSRLIGDFFVQNEILEKEVEFRKRSEAELIVALEEKDYAETERMRAEVFLEQQQEMLQLNALNADAPLEDLLNNIVAMAARSIHCERVGIWLYNHDESCIIADSIYELSSGSFVPGGVCYEKEYPVYFSRLKRDALIVASNAANDPATAAFSEKYLAPMGITSMLDVPVRNGNRVIGVVCYEHIGPQREWTISEQVFAKSLSDIIALNIEREERRKAEDRLLKATMRFEETQELAHIGSWEYNFITHEVVWSEEMYRIFCLESTPEHQLFDAFRQRIHSDDLAVFDSAVAKLLESGASYSAEVRVLCPGGKEKYILAIGDVIRSRRQGKVIGMRGTVQDITRQKEAAMAKSEFLSCMSHEIRTPINGVIGIANLLQDEDLNERQKEYVRTLNFTAQHLYTVVSDILDFSKIESGHMSFERVSFNLEKNCRDVLNLFAGKAEEKNLTVHFNPAPMQDYSLYGDYVRLNQVLSNLLSNAIKFTAKGSVTLSYTVENENRHRVKLRFSVRDTGIGISEIQQKHIFESFTQANETITRQYGGTGLGLTICKKLVELQGGSITLNSREGEGSEFIVTLEFEKHVYSENVLRTITTAEKNSLKELKGMRILVAEDNHVNAMVLTRFLSKWKIESVVVKDGAEALDLLNRELFDLVLMDIQMPGMDGIEATRHIRHSVNPSVRDIPVAAFTADASQDTHRELLRLGFNHCLTKPFNPDALFSFLKKQYETQSA